MKGIVLNGILIPLMLTLPIYAHGEDSGCCSKSLQAAESDAVKGPCTKNLKTSLTDVDKKKCPKPLQTCLNDMIRELKTTGFIGVELDFGCTEDQLIVTKVIEGSPAEKADIRVGDELYGINGIKFGEKNEAAISKVKIPGATVTCNVKRNGADREFKVTLVPMPADVMAKYIGEHMLEHARSDAELAKK